MSYHMPQAEREKLLKARINNPQAVSKYVAWLDKVAKK